jgi:enoyl-CoA hydratase/carnithine racemase
MPAMSTVRVSDREGGVRVLVLDRPKANAINEDLLADLDAAIAAAGIDDRVRAIVLTGGGNFFSAGFDFSAPRRDAAETQRIGELYRDAHVRLLSVPKPTVGMMNGHTIAGGLVLLLACDYRLGLDGDYRIGLNEIAVGASFPKAAMEIVRLRLPHARACELVLGAALYPASQALRLGIVDELLPADKLEDTVMRRAARLGAFPRDAYAHSKAALITDALERIAKELPDEAARTAAVWTSEESRAARAKQREKLGIKGDG